MIMSNFSEFTKYDDVLTSILINEKSILGFLSAIFNFLSRRTDFYHVPEGQYENMGFPPGVAEELVIKVLRKCDPKNWKEWKVSNDAQQITDINNDIMCSTVAHEVEVVAENDDGNEIIESLSNTTLTGSTSENIPATERNNDIEGAQGASKPLKETPNRIPDDYCPPVIPTQRNCETYNGAQRDKYSWSQTIMELDVTVNLPPDIKSSKDLKVTINPNDICIACRNGDVIIKDKLLHKIKALDSFWSISEGKLLIHLEKVQERWWNKFLYGEEEIDLSKIDCSRPLDELPEDHIAKVRELQWSQERKMQGLPTADEMRNIEILKKAWNAAGSPFQGQPFDPSVLKSSSMTDEQ